ncbi:MAG TPA: SIR2 family protein [Candidatus Acidoferrum sp.]|nr:SIR2 family protein [Candidatus Acidoferrum sp.]
METIRDRNVYILGAGFSAPAGVPVVHDFIDRSRIYFDDPSSRLDETERQHFERFLDFKRRMSQAREKVKIDLDDVEQLFGLVEISQRLGQEKRETRNSTVYVIAKTLELATRSQRAGDISFLFNHAVFNKMQGILPPGFDREANRPETVSAELYQYFSALASGLLDDPDKRASRSNTFITFNYDLLLDDSLRRVGVTPEYYLPIRRTSVQVGETPDRSCPVLKLHGSTNWGICGHCRKQILVLDQKVTASPMEFRTRTCQKCGKAVFQPLLIPPSWDKSEYREIMKPVWAKAVEELKLASRICVVGYSMPEADSFFKYLMALALSENHNLYKFIVVDRSPQIAERYRQLLDPMFSERRLWAFAEPGGFSSFLSLGRSFSELGRGEFIAGNIGRT